MVEVEVFPPLLQVEVGLWVVEVEVELFPPLLLLFPLLLLPPLLQVEVG